MGLPVWEKCKCSGMSIFRFSAEFRFFFLTFRFFENDFPLFLKNQKKKRSFFRLPTPPLSTVRRASVNSRWRHGLPVCASSVSGRSSKVPYLHSAFEIWRSRPCCVLAYSLRCLRRRGGWWFIELQHLHPLLFHPHHFTHTHTHTLSLSLSLSLSHTHTHTLPAAAISR